MDRCLEYFPANTASDLECDAVDIFNNQTVRIKAVRCNGIVECKDNFDEKDCKVEKYFLLVTIALGLAILLILTILTVASVDIIYYTEECKGILSSMRMVSHNLGLEELRKVHPLIVISQGTNVQKTINSAFVQHLKNMFSYDLPFVIKTIKVRVTTIQNIFYSFSYLKMYLF